MNETNEVGAAPAPDLSVETQHAPQEAVQNTMPAGELPDLPRYRSHKIVSAAKVVHLDGDGSMVLDRLDGRDQFTFRFDAAWLDRHKPVVGGYVVRYEDGYTSFSPEKAFKDGYVRHEDPPSPPAATEPVRELHGHQVNPANEVLRIGVMDGPGSGGAHHHYEIAGFDSSSNPSDPFVRRHGEAARHCTLLFQNGPIAEVGVNGITHEALLAILIDRLEHFQRGAFACEENAKALAAVNLALDWLHHRTRVRVARGVEGTMTP